MGFLQIAQKKNILDGTTAVVALVCHGFEKTNNSANGVVETAIEGQPGTPPLEGQPPERQPGTSSLAVGGIAKLFVAWCGDSRAVLLRGRQAIRCSEDHRPSRTDEQQR